MFLPFGDLFACELAAALTAFVFVILGNLSHLRDKMPGVFDMGAGFCNNRPHSIYQYYSMAPRLSGQNYKIVNFFCLSIPVTRLGYKVNNTKYGSLS